MTFDLFSMKRINAMLRSTTDTTVILIHLQIKNHVKQEDAAGLLLVFTRLIPGIFNKKISNRSLSTDSNLFHMLCQMMITSSRFLKFRYHFDKLIIKFIIELTSLITSSKFVSVQT